MIAPYILSALVIGQKRLTRKKTFSEEHARFYTCEMALALDYLHSLGPNPNPKPYPKPNPNPNPTANL